MSVSAVVADIIRRMRPACGGCASGGATVIVSACVLGVNGVWWGRNAWRGAIECGPVCGCVVAVCAGVGLWRCVEMRGDATPDCGGVVCWGGLVEMRR